MIMHFFSYNDASIIVSLLHACMHKQGVIRLVCLSVCQSSTFWPVSYPGTQSKINVNAAFMLFLDGKKLAVACK